jgi:carbon monoxide dehydrogenase subunit G
MLAMKLQHTLSYEADPATVFAVLSDPEYVAEKCTATGAMDSTVDITHEGPDTVIVTMRKLPADDLPSFAKSFVGDAITVDQTERWGAPASDGSREGTLTATFRGTPMKVEANMRLSPGGAGSELRVAGDVKSGIPLMGGSIESFAAEQLTAGLDREAEVANARL